MRNTLFWKIYAVFVSVLVIVAILGTGLLLSWLEAFEKSQPIHSAKAVFNDYFVTEKWSEVLKLSGYEKGVLETDSAYQKVLSANFSMTNWDSIGFMAVSDANSSATVVCFRVLLRSLRPFL